jgi:anti-sigma factor RsiW
MSHQPFEDWILDYEDLPLPDRRALQAHMDTCQQCQRLQRRWQSARQELHARRMAAPAPGFTQRWQASLVERRARAQRKQAWKIFGILSGSALLMLLVLAGYLMATSTTTDWLVILVTTVSSSTNLFSVTVYVVQTWLVSIPLAVNIVLWIYLTISLCLLSLLWVMILWRTNIVGVLGK